MRRYAAIERILHQVASASHGFPLVSYIPLSPVFFVKDSGDRIVKSFSPPACHGIPGIKHRELQSDQRAQLHRTDLHVAVELMIQHRGMAGLIRLVVYAGTMPYLSTILANISHWPGYGAVVRRPIRRLDDALREAIRALKLVPERKVALREFETFLSIFHFGYATRGMVVNALCVFRIFSASFFLFCMKPSVSSVVWSELEVLS